MARFCPNCGQPVTENEKFCHQCGSPLQTSVDSQPTVDSQPANRLGANTPVPNADNISIQQFTAFKPLAHRPEPMLARP